MKSLPLKLGIAVVLLFAVVITTCLLWTPVKIRYHVGKLRSNDLHEAVQSVDRLLGMGGKGVEELKRNFPDGREAAELLISCWKDVDAEIKDPAILISFFDGKDFLILSTLEGDNCTALHVTAFRGYLVLSKMLVFKGVPVSVCAEFKCQAQCMEDDEFDAFITPSGTPLHFAVRNGHFEIMSFLVENGADIYAKDGWAATLLHEAAEKGNRDVAALLIAKGLDVNAETVIEWTPLHKAANEGHKDVAELLIENGAYINGKRNSWCSPLHLAAFCGHEETAAMLIDKGAEVMARDKDGETPLHHAVYRGHDSASELLIEKGADINALCMKGKSPLDVAVERNQEKTADFLRARGGKTGEEIREQKKKETGK